MVLLRSWKFIWVGIHVEQVLYCLKYLPPKRGRLLLLQMLFNHVCPVRLIKWIIDGNVTACHEGIVIHILLSVERALLGVVEVHAHIVGAVMRGQHILRSL